MTPTEKQTYTNTQCSANNAEARHTLSFPLPETNENTIQTAIQSSSKLAENKIKKRLTFVPLGYFKPPMNTSIQKLEIQKKQLIFNPFFAKNDQKHTKNGIFSPKTAKIQPINKIQQTTQKKSQQENLQNS
jgi:hypothetical protein